MHDLFLVDVCLLNNFLTSKMKIMVVESLAHFFFQFLLCRIPVLEIAQPPPLSKNNGLPQIKINCVDDKNCCEANLIEHAEHAVHP